MHMTHSIARDESIQTADDAYSDREVKDGVGTYNGNASEVPISQAEACGDVLLELGAACGHGICGSPTPEAISFR
jgi:hypothetical protein